MASLCHEQRIKENERRSVHLLDVLNYWESNGKLRPNTRFTCDTQPVYS